MASKSTGVGSCSGAPASLSCCDAVHHGGLKRGRAAREGCAVPGISVKGAAQLAVNGGEAWGKASAKRKQLPHAVGDTGRKRHGRVEKIPYRYE